MNKTQKAIVVGGGIGGLATAILLAKQGYQVEVYEKNTQLGGRASLLEIHGFTFDMGPSRYLMPDVFQRFFKKIGEDIHDHLKLKKLSPSYRIFFSYGGHEKVDVTGNIGDDIKTFEKLEPGVKDKFLEYLKISKKHYKKGMKFVYKNYDGRKSLFSRDVIKSGIELPLFQKFSQYIQRFFSDPRLQKIIQYPLVFLGTSPFDAPALYDLMSYADFELGVFYPKGGIYEIVKALVKIGEKHGVKFYTDHEVEKLEIEKGSNGTTAHHGEIKKIIFKDKEISVESSTPVVVNADMAFAETHFLDPQFQTYTKTFWDKKMFAPSGFILYLGLDKKLKNVTHHNLIFSENWKKNFGEIFDTKVLPEDPSLYMCVPSITDHSVAPAGHENLFVLVPIPNGISISNEQHDIYRNLILTLIEENIGESIRDHIVVEEKFEVKDFTQRYNAWQGTALGLSHTLFQSAFRRPNNISQKVNNLFYVGHNTNPGIGMPMVLISAELVAERVKGTPKK